MRRVATRLLVEPYMGALPLVPQTPGPPGIIGTFVDVTPAQIPAMQPFSSPQFGTQSIAIAPSAPNVIYVATCYNGIYRSADYGRTWVKTNTGTLGSDIDLGRAWTIAVDPTDPNTLYTTPGFGTGAQGVLKSTDGGVNWVQKFTATENSNATSDVYAITIDPTNHLHLLVTSHSGWSNGANADSGVLESTDGGATWTLHGPITGVGTGAYAFFLNQDDSGVANNGYWLLATQTGGYWRTTNSGSTWTQVHSAHSMQHGANMMYRASTGALYIGAAASILLRSTDNGQTWSVTSTGLPSNADGYNAVLGDGTYIYVCLANTGVATAGSPSFYYSLETDGLSWTQYNTQTFYDGPMSMAIDKVSQSLYASCWCGGVWKLLTGH